MSFFRPSVDTVTGVQKRVWIHDAKREGSTRSANQYLSRLAPRRHSFFFELDRSLAHAGKRVRGEVVGAVVFSTPAFALAESQGLVVAIPVRGTHDNRAYLAAQVSSEQIMGASKEKAKPEGIAELAAALAIYGYLHSELMTQELHGVESTEHMLATLWRQR